MIPKALVPGPGEYVEVEAGATMPGAVVPAVGMEDFVLNTITLKSVSDLSAFKVVDKNS